ncbi:uncharacterized protein LOC108678683 [Hyalella azteca]|uniref:Uncharacterized protein LOC108678683 n=1 Tax=Hyalella azteca TaxID=294128 RepID=A0A8B7PA22_HYAAZ|nr:uncharacterized protein LOC108678683 [Hyalella azteca]
MYGCINDWLNNCKHAAEPCRNGGYTTKDCKCACPLGTTGANCENFIMSYNDALVKQISPDSTNITTPDAEVISPGYYTLGSTQDKNYTQVLRAPKCQRAVATFEDFRLKKRSSEGEFRCDANSLEIHADVSVSAGEI